MKTPYQDEFSTQAADYARYRPHYPVALFAYLAECAPARQQAWDCATGSGQAALALARHFDHVIATDASEQQIDYAEPHPCVEYRVARAEQPGIDDQSIDLVTVAQALHWFELEAFYQVLQRVLKPGGIVAAWTYNLFVCDSAIDAIVRSFYSDTLGPYWPAARQLVEQGYDGIEFPFEELTPPPFAMETDWDLEMLLGYLATWSAVVRYRKATGLDPLVPLRLQLAGVWGDPQKRRRISWPLKLRAGRYQP